MENTLEISRHVKATPEMVFDAFTDPAHISLWWGPRGFTTSTIEHDLRVGGRWRFIMHGPDGKDWDNRIDYTEVVPHSRLAYQHGTDVDNDPSRWEVVVTFDDVDDGTLITLHSTFATADQYNAKLAIGAVEGGKETLARLDDYINAADVVFTYERTFNAPRDLVWEVLTTEEHMRQWWGPKGMTMLKSALDLRPGGTYHYGMSSADGTEMWGMLRYRDIVPPRRLVFIVNFSDALGGITRHPLAANWPMHVLSVATLTETNGKTTITINSMPINATEDEMAMFASAKGGMLVGTNGMYDVFEQYLATL